MSLVIEAQTIPLKEDRNGVMRISNTRVTLETVVHAFEQGHVAEEIVNHYPSLRLADVYAVISYYLNNRPEVQTYLQQQQDAANKVWELIDAQGTHQEFRQRLLARHQASTNHAHS